MIVHFSAHISKWELVCKFGVIFHIFIISCLCSRFHLRNQWFCYLFIYQVLCTLIYRRRSLYSFLGVCRKLEYIQGMSKYVCNLCVVCLVSVCTCIMGGVCWYKCHAPAYDGSMHIYMLRWMNAKLIFPHLLSNMLNSIGHILTHRENVSKGAKVLLKNVFLIEIFYDDFVASNGNSFRVTGPLWGKSTGDRRIPLTKDSDVELWNRWANNRDAGNLRCHHPHYDVTVMMLVYKHVLLLSLLEV